MRIYQPQHTYAVIEKARGETPRAALERWRTAQNIHPRIPLSYAGRLDPLASGKLLVLMGDECTRQDYYRSLDKEYVFELLCGVSTDTGDILGMPTYAPAPAITATSVQQALARFIGTRAYPYPQYASHVISGKSLTEWSHIGHIWRDGAPEGLMTYDRLVLERVDMLTCGALHERVEHALASVSETAANAAMGNAFRITEIRAAWEHMVRTATSDTFPVFTIRATCASGAYIRSLAPCVARSLRARGMALSIERTMIGRFRRVRIPGLPEWGFWQYTL